MYSIAFAFVLLLVAQTQSVGLPHKHTCVEARESYKVRNQDINFAYVDPVFYYNKFGKKAGRQWPLDLCETAPLYPDHSACNCTLAISQFQYDYPKASGDYFSYWVANFAEQGIVWHCELCTAYSRFKKPASQDTTSGALYRRDDDSKRLRASNSSSTTGPTSPPAAGMRGDQCLQARLDYWARYPDTREIDPVYDYSRSSSRVWDATLCADSAIYLNDEVCQCSAAQELYRNQHPTPGTGYDTPYQYWVLNGQYSGYAWHCEYCPGVVKKQEVTSEFVQPQCSCLAARDAYSASHPSSYDPIYYFAKLYVAGVGGSWDCPCDDYSINIDDPVCNCSAAVNSYVAAHPDAEYYHVPFLHYWNNYLEEGFNWDCSLCVVNNTNPPTAKPTLPPRRPFVNESTCTCLAARNDYYSRYPDVAIRNFDAVKYRALDDSNYLVWNCELCDASPRTIYDSFCNCSAARNRYILDANTTRNYDSVPDGTDPYSHWLGRQDWVAWHCELCENPDVEPADESCNCLAASTYYLYQNPDIQTDPYYHYRWFGKKQGRKWNCDLCAEPQAHYATESVCDCPLGRDMFQSRYPSLTAAYASQYADLHGFWASTSKYFGNVWNCTCTNVVENPATSRTCNCSAAREAFIAKYNPPTDPWDYYTSGVDNGVSWDCSICNDTCPGGLPATQYTGATWGYSGQYVSPQSASLTLLPGCYVPLTGSVSVTTTQKIYVQGVLGCDTSTSSSIQLKTNNILVTGIFVCGTNTDPMRGNLNITLTGVLSSPSMESRAVPHGGYKSLTVYQGGKLYLHGAKQVSWTRLTATAAEGAETIQVADAVDWEAGDIIVLATTDIPVAITNLADNETDPKYNEEVVIVKVEGKVITFSPKLKFTHLGDRIPIATTNMTIDRFAEVGLVSRRNIIISGDTRTSMVGYGAQLVAMNNGTMRISGVLITLAGQKAAKYRYPVHWYNANSPGQYFNNSTIKTSYNRCVVVTATNAAVIANNFCYNFVGAGFVTNTGQEVGNTFAGNLALHSIRPPVSTFVDFQEVSNDLAGYGPPSFLFKCPNNRVINNAAVDSMGSGFWYAVDLKVEWPGSIYVPTSEPYGTIRGNVAHSVLQAFNDCPRTPGLTKTPIATVDTMRIYAAKYGIYACNPFLYFNRMVVVDTQSVLQYASFIQRPIGVMDSAIVSSVVKPPYGTATVVTANYGEVILQDTFLVNYTRALNATVFRPQHNSGFSTANILSNTILVNSDDIFSDSFAMAKNSFTGEWGSVMNDLTGHMFGARATFVSSHPLMYDDNCQPLQNGYNCPHHYVSMGLTWGYDGVPPTKILRVPFDPLSLPTTVNTTSPSAVLFPPPTSKIMRFAAMGNANHIYQVVLPVTSHTQIEAFSISNGKPGDFVRLQFFNAKAFKTGPISKASCLEVWTSSVSTYFYDEKGQYGCAMIVATNGTDFQSSVFLAVGCTSGDDYSLQPPKPYVDPLSLPERHQCIAAMEDYWRKYPDVAIAQIDPVFHFQTYGSAEKNSWDVGKCLVEPRYISEPYCSCIEAQEQYYKTRRLNETSSLDSYNHYLLYQLVLGWGYNCSLCNYQQPPYIPPTTTPTPSSTTGSTSGNGNGNGNGKGSDESKILGYDPGLSAGLGAFTAIGAVIALICAVFLGMFWNAFAKHGPFYCSLIIAGVLLSYCAVFILLPHQTDALCLAFPWFLGVAFSLVYGCLFIKTWALYQVWRNAKNFQRTNLTPAYIMKGILLYLGVEVIYLIIWTVIDPPKLTLETLYNGDRQYTCTCENVVFWVLFIVVKFIWLAFGAVLSFLTRNMVKEYNESKSIAYAIYNIVLLGVIGGPVVAYVSATGIPGAVLVIEVVLIVLAFTFTLISLFGGIIFGIIHPAKGEFKLSQMAQKRDGSGHSRGHSHSSSGGPGFSDEHRSSSDGRSGVKTQEVFLA